MVRRKGKANENISKEIMTELLLDYFTELNQLLIFHIRIDLVSLMMNTSRWETLYHSVLGVFRFPCPIKPSLAIKRFEHRIIYSPFTLKFRKTEVYLDSTAYKHSRYVYRGRRLNLSF